MRTASKKHQQKYLEQQGRHHQVVGQQGRHHQAPSKQQGRHHQTAEQTFKQQKKSPVANWKRPLGSAAARGLERVSPQRLNTQRKPVERGRSHFSRLNCRSRRNLRPKTWLGRRRVCSLVRGEVSSFYSLVGRLGLANLALTLGLD
jgi:hypothetical protein